VLIRKKHFFQKGILKEGILAVHIYAARPSIKMIVSLKYEAVEVIPAKAMVTCTQGRVRTSLGDRLLTPQAGENVLHLPFSYLQLTSVVALKSQDFTIS
jgi:hypothetical protein